MTNTKKSLLTSALSMLLCVAMLLGTTFAWFTDNATNTGNRIVAGNLEVDLIMYDGNSATADGYSSIKDGSGDIFAEAAIAQNSNATLWEPGKTQVVYLGVRNLGNLALKYEVIVNVKDNGLASALEYALVSDVDYAAAQAAGITDWTALKAAATSVGEVSAITNPVSDGGVLDEVINGTDDETDYFVLAVHMKESAGNEYQGKDAIIDVAINATQVDAEKDSFGKNYDAGLVFGEDVNRVNLPVRVTEAVVNNNGTAANDVVLENADNTVKATVPAGTALEEDATNLTLTIVETDEPVGFQLAADEEAATVDIKIDGVADTNGEPIVITISDIFAANLNNVMLYHEGTPMTKVASAAAVDADGEFFYDVRTGTVTLATDSFSKFTATYDAVKADSMMELPKAIIETLSDKITVNVDGVDRTLDAAYLFKTTDKYEEAQTKDYALWNADFVVRFDKAVKAETAGLAGSYASWKNGEWVAFNIPMDVEANEPVRLLKSAEVRMNYEELCKYVKEFSCGAFDIEGANKGTTMTVELRLYETSKDATNSEYETGKSYIISSTSYTF